jgi:TPR repeat protein
MHLFARCAFRNFLFCVAVIAGPATECLCEPKDAPPEKKMTEVRARADQGYIEQQIELAGAYLTGRGVPRDAAQAAHSYLKAAEGGSPEAQNQIGYFYQEGIGVKADEERALHWFQLASAAGMASAKVNLGVSYLRGQGVPKDASTARQLFLEAVDKGSGIAATYLGLMDCFGVGVPQDNIAAEHWFETGAKLHDPEAAFDLAVLFSAADGPRRDLRRAVELLRFAAGKGYVPAKHSLGLLLLQHAELARSEQEARLLLEEASNAGSWKSSVLLGILARDGRGGPADPLRAYYCFQLAALEGGKDGQGLVGHDINALQQKLSAEQQAGITAQASAWFQQHPVPLVFVLNQDNSDSRFPLLAVADPGLRP